MQMVLLTTEGQIFTTTGSCELTPLLHSGHGHPLPAVLFSPSLSKEKQRCASSPQPPSRTLRHPSGKGGGTARLPECRTCVGRWSLRHHCPWACPADCLKQNSQSRQELGTAGTPATPALRLQRGSAPPAGQPPEACGQVLSREIQVELKPRPVGFPES